MYAAGDYTKVNAAGLKKLRLDSATFNDFKSGFKSALFYDKGNDKYVLAFAGTDGAVRNDNVNNASQPFGMSRQYSQAVALVQVDMAVPCGSLAMVGHSLGGGMASLASLTTAIKDTRSMQPV